MKPIPVIQREDFSDFRKEISDKYEPVIIRDVNIHWDLVKMAKASAKEALEAVRALGASHALDIYAGAPEIKGRYSYTDDMKGFNFEKRTIPLGEFCDLLLGEYHKEEPASYLASSIPLKGNLEPLRSQLLPPFLDPAQELLISFWIGNRARTAAHWDLPQNLACPIAGRRKFTLFPIDQLKNLYIGPQEFTLSGQATSLVDFHAPDFNRFPRFAEALAHGLEGEVGPGDMIFIPCLWFHHVESLDPIGLMINYWWREGPEHLITPKYTLYHAALTLKEMPLAERLAWRKVIDHYIFEMNGDPMDHLPDHAKGMLGDLNPVQRQQLRQFLIKSLS